MEKKLLEKYFNNNCTPEEINLVLSWFKDLTSKNVCRHCLSQLWEELSADDLNTVINSDKILNKIHQKINTLEENAGNDLIRYDRRQLFLQFLKNVAAILIIPLIGLSLFMSVRYYSVKYSQILSDEIYNEVSFTVDAITKVKLPDGSTVWLNHGSSLRYPEVFNGDFRQVELKGEGYFEVTHNSKIPFAVNTDKIQVLALGTTFNVMAYPEEDIIETSLIKGTVEFRKPIPGDEMETLYTMNPSDLLIYEKDNDQISVKEISDYRYFSWKDGKLIFTGEAMEDVVKKLNRRFNVDIQIKDPKLNDLTLTATFVNETLNEVLELLSHVFPISYFVYDGEITSYGTFSKRKVILNYVN